MSHLENLTLVQFSPLDGKQIQKSGPPVFAGSEIVSPVGDTKREEFSETPTTQRVCRIAHTGKAVFTRVAKGPPGSHALSGLWQMPTVSNTASIGPLTTCLGTQDGLKLKMSAANESYDAIAALHSVNRGLGFMTLHSRRGRTLHAKTE